MVGVSTIITICITLCICLIVPLAVYIIYGVKNKGKGVWTAWLLGAAGFAVPQLFIRVPILNVLALSEGFQKFAEKQYVSYCLILAFTAGLFEVAGRFAVAKILSKKMNYERAIAAGLGHGGIEAMFLVGMTYINNLIYSILINTGTFITVIEQTEASGVDVSQLVAVQEALINTNSVTFLLAGYERILTMIFHLAMSLLVCYFVSQKQACKGVFICLLSHTTVDFVSPLISGLATDYLGNVISTNTSYIIIYAFLTAIAVASIVVIMKLKKKFGDTVSVEM